MKMTNLNRIFADLRRQGPLSRAELAIRNQLSPTTVSHLIGDLMRLNMVREIGAGQSSGSGRKPILLEINPQGGYLMVVELGSRGYRLVLFNLILQVVARVDIKITDFTRLGDQMANSATSLLQDSHIVKEELLGIVFAVPALIDHKTSRVITSTVIPFSPDDDFVRIMGERLQVPIRLGNESAFWCYAEYFQGSGYPESDMAFIDVGDGIGCGLMINGQLFHGAHGLQGEIGHITINYQGATCPCHNRGCLELYASLPALERRAAELAQVNRQSLLAKAQDENGHITFAALLAAWEAGDSLADKLIQEEAEYLAYGVNNLINMMDPSDIVLGGAIRLAGEPFFQRLNEALDKISQNTAATGIRTTSLPDEAMASGAAQWLLDDLIGQSQVF
ncbi:MAG: ROK family transcriptional regulator [Clostridiaceae bacterium]|nr:ROK family transcriptional regulator [Clostridiaceae bacterium]